MGELFPVVDGGQFVERGDPAQPYQHVAQPGSAASSNRQKGDHSPDQWAPPLRSYSCTCARAWIHVKYVYELNITGPEKNTLDEMPDTCPA